MKWTEDEAIAFECARETITDMMAICSRKIAQEQEKLEPDNEHLALLEAELARLAGERAALHGLDHVEIARIRAYYGAITRAHLME
jgi:hypothetical protein